MENEIYTLSANGMKRLSRRPELPKGTVVYSFGAGMLKEKWATTGNGNEIVKLSENSEES